MGLIRRNIIVLLFITVTLIFSLVGFNPQEVVIGGPYFPQIKYFAIEEKMTLGKKRNYMHEKSSGSYIVYMDDDDYYPPESILARVKTLMKYKDKGEYVGSFSLIISNNVFVVLFFVFSEYSSIAKLNLFDISFFLLIVYLS